MLQYLLNTTSIWLTSLVLFDVFLRKETYHGYNRAYLLITFLLGALLPLWQWQDADGAYTTLLATPVQQVIHAKQTIVTATTPDTSIGWEQWLAGIYAAGALVALALLIADVVKLVVLYRNGTKVQESNWRIIETGKEHAPFSFLNTLFVCSRQQYSTDEWNMILVHEQRHSALLHFADLLLMQPARIVFWFHPLVYIYNKRLLLVHEYQADNASAQQPQVYGRFLVEQAVLQAAPSITHSFNRSPIKKRIVMLTRRSSAASRVKMLVFIPLALVCIVCFSKNVFSQKFDKDTPRVKIANIDTGQHNATCEQILANPRLTAVDPESKVTSFTMTFIPIGRFLMGPYKSQGPELTERQIDSLRGLSGTHVNIVFEDIHLNQNGKDVLAYPIFLKCKK